MTKFFFTERAAVMGAFVWSEGPAMADWLDIVVAVSSIFS